MIKLHRGFNKYNYDSDIALLRLTEPVQFTERVQLICLPTNQFLHLSEANLENGMNGTVRYFFLFVICTNDMG